MSSSTPPRPSPAAGSPRAPRLVDQPDFLPRLDALIRDCGGDPATFEGKLIRDQLLTSLKLLSDGRGTGELKLLTAAFKELRYAYNVFDDYPEPHKISIFGSARTPPTHPDYLAAVDFSRRMAQAGWLVITGAGDGIMKAGHEGPGREASFGLSIRLPFETNANEVIAGDSKLIHFRYFFTRKLMFLSQCEAICCFPGGFGTQDELFESLTLVQTGKSPMIPIVMLEGPGGTYWNHFDRYIRGELLAGKFVSAEDPGIYYIARDPQDAVEHILRFYRNYHSSRYVQDDYVIRLHRPLRPADVETLNSEFSVLVKTGRIEQRGPYEVEDDHLTLPRLAFTHTRRGFGKIRQLIDRINSFDTGA
ncbi:MAG: LOG family protein [Phycisphaerales bacterium]|nr:LOG family protein [Phycisphaerales bacterium]